MNDADDTTGQEPNTGAERPADQPGASGQGQTPNQPPDTTGSQDDLAHLPERDRDYIRQLRSENARRRTSEKQLADELQAIRDRDKTEQQRMTEELDALRSEKAAWEYAKTASAVARDKGIPLEWADRLRGSTREELEEDADRLQSMIGGANGDGRDERYTDFDAGVRGSSPGVADMNQLIRRSAGRG